MATEASRTLKGISPLQTRNHSSRSIGAVASGGVPYDEAPLERACALAKGSVLESADIHLDIRPAKAVNGAPGFLPDGMTLEQWEDEMVQEALRRANGNKSQAARLLGLSRNALRYRLSKIGIADEEKDS